MKTNRGFTVIELLVVISIIGILAMVITVAVNMARERGRMASAIQMEANVLHATGDQLALEWKFDNTSGTSPDTPGNSRNGTVTGATWSATGGYNGSGAYAFNGGSSLIANTFASPLPGSSGTISFWVNPATVTPGGLFDTGGNQYGLFIRGDTPGRLTFGMHTKSVVSFNNFFPEENRWYLVTVVWNGSTAIIYKDGGSSFQKGDIGGSPTTLTWVTVGRDDTGTSYSTIDNVRIYARAFTAMDVQKLYAQTNPAYLALNQ